MSKAMWIVNDYIMARPELEGLISAEDIYPVAEPTTGHGIPFILYDFDLDVMADLYALQRIRVRYYIYSNDLVVSSDIVDIFKWHLGREGVSMVPASDGIAFDYFKFRGSTLMPPLEEGGPYTNIAEFEFQFRDINFQ